MSPGLQIHAAFNEDSENIASTSESLTETFSDFEINRIRHLQLVKMLF